MLILVFEVIVEPPKHTFEIEFFFVFLVHCAIILGHFFPDQILFANDGASDLFSSFHENFPISQIFRNLEKKNFR